MSPTGLKLVAQRGVAKVRQRINAGALLKAWPGIATCYGRGKRRVPTTPPDYDPNTANTWQHTTTPATAAAAATATKTITVTSSGSGSKQKLPSSSSSSSYQAAAATKQQQLPSSSSISSYQAAATKQQLPSSSSSSSHNNNNGNQQQQRQQQQLPSSSSIWAISKSGGVTRHPSCSFSNTQSKGMKIEPQIWAFCPGYLSRGHLISILQPPLT